MAGRVDFSFYLITDRHQVCEGTLPEVCSAALRAGVRAILNFSPGSPRVPPHVKLKNMDLTITFESLSFFLANGHVDP